MELIRPEETTLTVAERRARSIAEIKTQYPDLINDMVAPGWLKRAVAR